MSTGETASEFPGVIQRLALVDDDDVSEMMLGLVRRDLSELRIFREICELQVLTWSLCVSFCRRLHELLRPECRQRRIYSPCLTVGIC